MEANDSDNWIATTAVVIPIFSGLACVISIPPLIIFIRAKSIPVAILFIIVTIQNVMHLTNAILWPDTNIGSWWDGNILCDIEVKLIIAFDIASASCVACIFRQLASILDLKSTGVLPTKKQKRWNLLVEVLTCVVLPTIIACLHYVVQPQRYYIYPIHGCAPTFDASWPSYAILLSWPPVACLAAVGYGVLTVVRVIKHRRENAILFANAQNNAEKSRFNRLFVMASVMTILIIPLTVFRIYSLPKYWYTYSWSRIHPPDWSSSIIFVSSYSIRQILFDLVSSSCSFLLFAWFCIGREAAELYKSLLRKLTHIKTFFRNMRERASKNQPQSNPAPVERDMYDLDIIFKDLEETPRHNAPSN